MSAFPPDARPLRDLDEARGQLLKVLDREGFAVAVFSWGAISLPGELASRLHELLGKKIGILRLDGYHVREVE